MSKTAQDLNAAIRDLIDVVRTSDFDDTDLATATSTVQALADELRPLVHAGMRMQAALKYENLMDDVSARMEQVRAEIPRAEADTGLEQDVLDPNEFFPYSPVVGGLNPIAPPVNMWRASGEHGQEIHGEASLGAAYNGPPGCVHGGVIAEVFDELLGCVCVSNGLGGFTGTLTVIYRNTTPLDEPLTLRGWHDRTEGRKVFAKGTLFNGDTLCAEAEGIFILSDQLPGPPGA